MPVADRRAALWAAALALTAGCSIDNAPTASDLSFCSTANDCDPSQVCINLQCVAADVPDDVMVEITPAGGSPFVQTQFLGVPLNQRPLTFSMPVPTSYRIEVFDGQLQRVASSVTFFSTEGFVDRPLVVDEFVTADDPSFVRLAPGSYSITLRPNVGPSLEELGFTVRAQPDTVEKPFLFPSRFRQLSGAVTWLRSSQVALPGVEVRAFGLSTGLASTTTVTDASGHFAISLPDTNEEFFRLEASPPDDQQPNWSYRQTVRVDRGADRIRNIEMELANADDIGTVRLQVVGVDREGLGRPVAGAQVVLTATVSGVDVPPIFSLEGTTDSDGQLRIEGETTDEVPLIRARYDVEVRPPLGSEFRATRTALDLTDAGMSFSLDEQVTLPIRTLVRGSVLSNNEQPLAEALITFSPLDGGPSITVVAGPTGVFETDLDPTAYLMIVEPLNARAGTEPVPVATTTVQIDDAPTQSLPAFVLPPGTNVEGLVIGPTGAPELGAHLDLFVMEQGQLVRIAEARTNSRGLFNVVVESR